MVVDSLDNNLVFGSGSIYNPNNVELRASNGNLISIWKHEGTGTIQFSLEENYTTYYFFLTDTVIDTLKFDIAQRKSETCCGYVTYSTKTFINGNEIVNSDKIKIIK
ncbi:hypothetical protein ACFLRZ_05050 [Bacteroidota bacterium]